MIKLLTGLSILFLLLCNVEAQEQKANIDSSNIQKAQDKTQNCDFNLLTPTAYPIRKGELYYRNKMIIINTIGYGITENFSINAGFDLVTFYVSLNNKFNDSPTFYILPKYSYSLFEKVKVGASFFYLNSKHFLFDESYGISSLSAYYGSENKNIGINLGTNILNREKHFRKNFMIINGLLPLSKRVFFESEFLMLGESIDESILTYGLKFISNNMAIDFGFINSLDLIELYLGIPVVSFTINI